MGGIFDLIYTIYEDTRGDVAKFQYLTPIVIPASVVICALVVYQHDRLQRRHSSGLVILFWLGLVIHGSLKLRTYILIARDQVLLVYSLECVQSILHNNLIL